jgi:hypothetical protein
LKELDGPLAGSKGAVLLLLADILAFHATDEARFDEVRSGVAAAMKVSDR